ncbi:hypothetical protein PMIN04_009207 [Paraphaeosphaeria minitans]
MQFFKALLEATASPFKATAPPLESLNTTPYVLTITLINWSDLWIFLATHHAQIHPLDFYQALDDHVSAGRMSRPPNLSLADCWDTILVLNRTMATSTRPILPYTLYPCAPGLPVRFLVGSAQTPFDVHTSILVDASPCFTWTFIAGIQASLALPAITPEVFSALTKWLYARNSPQFSRANELQHLCELWVAGAQLGIYLKANTLLRLGMELMTPSDRVCDFATARWVFANTPAGCPLRGFVVAVLAQRSQPDFASPFQAGDVEIWRARSAFMGRLEHARRLLAFGTSNGDGSVTLGFEKGKQEGMGVGKGRLPMPDFLVWDEKVWNKMGEVVPDRFFVFPGTEEFEEGLVEWLKGE